MGFFIYSNTFAIIKFDIYETIFIFMNEWSLQFLNWFVCFDAVTEVFNSNRRDF